MARLLKIYRQERGWSQSELGRRSGIHASTISLIESGRLEPYDAQLAKIAKALKLSKAEVDKLMAEADA